MNSFFCGIFLILIGGAVALAIPERMKSIGLAIFSSAGCLLVFIPSLSTLLGSETLSEIVYLPYPVMQIRFVLDPLSSFFCLVISLMSLIGIVYASGYLKAYQAQKKGTGFHLFFISVLVSSMLLVCVIQNMLAFLFVWEIMSLSSFFLVIFDHEKKGTMRSGLIYITAMQISACFLICALGLLYSMTGSFDFDSFRILLGNQARFVELIFLLFFVGFGIKAGFIPFHSWLPLAHPAAPSHVSGIMSGIMIKTGIYGILRILSLTGIPSGTIAYFVLGISVFSALYGILYAIAQHDIKRLLAYSSVENIGIIGIGIGTGMLGLTYGINIMAFLGFAGALLHVLNHSIFKGLLFYGAGALYQQTHTCEIEKLGGLVKSMKAVAVYFLIGSAAICGLPLLNGFVSELLIYFGLFSGLGSGNNTFHLSLIISAALLALTGVMALLCFSKLFSIVFLGSPRTEINPPPREVSISMRFSMAVLCVFIITTGLFPGYFLKLVTAPALMFVQESNLSLTAVSTLLNLFSRFFLIFICIFTIAFLLRRYLLKKRAVSYFKTWDCAYQSPTNRMQYTGNSYAGIFLDLAKPFLKTSTRLEKPKEIFSQKAFFESRSDDYIEHFINKAGGLIRKFMGLFGWIQGGNTRQYIIYGIVFLILALIWFIVTD